ncbi:16S rRNA (uracil(1498)-N(3))-methyltransferase [Vagococcus elongatus]|uniref:Ribosomal RNA small subunit methyltransferase E n=1 Tax=Vagococcus elongatus TaxID=180344 RepID=A0A430AMF3_9ENTE|nr:16S rRNA (uracil(1498)-N(3))-methyltransferase [Vagococcus elongatus]RSU09133.1 16S rRNA (uracil(1498)-N(3))-methyltransferase [Vagococcus elongatus]
MQRYFIPTNYDEHDRASIEVAGEIFHHMIRVMRMKIGEQVYLVFNQKHTVVAEITTVAEEQAFLKEVREVAWETELPVRVSLFCGFPKGDKLELITQKSTELGASQVFGFPSKTSVVKWNEKKRLNREQRLNKIAKEAAEQSHRTAFPTVRLLETQKELFEELSAFDHILVAYEEAAKKGERSQLIQTLQQVRKGERLAFVFGPEGGLSPDEVALLEEAGGKVCSLGPRILRTETAPFYALSAVSFQLEMLN